MKLYILFFSEILLLFESSESPLSRTNNFSALSVRNFNTNSWDRNYNELFSTTDRDRWQVRSREILHGHYKNNDTYFQERGNRNNHSIQRINPLVATLELPKPHQNTLQPVNNLLVAENTDILIIPENSNYSNYSKEEIACFSGFKVFYNDSCLELLNECDKDKWLTLDLDSALEKIPKIKPKCSKKKCKKDYFYWRQTNSCHNKDYLLKNICPPGNDVTHDYFGYGTCVCEELNGLHTNGSCYPLYTQGPCLRGHLFVEQHGKTSCMKNPCKNSSLVPYNNDGNILCYELGKQGPCESQHTLEVSKLTREPACNNNIAPLKIINPPKFCTDTEVNKGCPPRIRVENHQSYIDRIIELANKRKGK